MTESLDHLLLHCSEVLHFLLCAHSGVWLGDNFSLKDLHFGWWVCDSIKSPVVFAVNPSVGRKNKQSLKTSGGLIYALFPVPGKEKEDDVEIIISVEAADSYRF